MPNKAQELIDTLIENELKERKGAKPEKSKSAPAAKKEKAKKTETAKKAEDIVNQNLADAGVGLRPRHEAMGAEQYQEYTEGLKEVEEGQRDPGMLEAAGKGITAGTIGIAEDVGTVTKYLGGKFKSPTMVEIGDTAEKYWANVKEEYEAPESLHGDIVMPDGSINTELLTKGSWWAYHVAQMVPSLAASVLPAAATIRGISAVGAGMKTVGTGAKAHKVFNLGKTAVKVKPATIDRLARIGGAVAGGAAGGALEGSGTFREVIERGGTPEEAASAAEMMFFASAGLNALSLDFMFKRLPNSAKGRMFKRFLNGAVEGATEYLEGPAEAKILLEGAKGASYEFTPEEFGDKIRQEANVIGPAFLLGMIMPVGALTGTPSKKKEKEPKKPIEDIKADQPTGVTVKDEEGEFIELSEADEALKQEFDILSGGVGLDEGPVEEIVMEATPEEQMETEIEAIDQKWGNAFDPAEYGENWSQEDRDTMDLLYEAADFNPAIVDEIARMAEVGESTVDINDLLIQTIQEGYNARLQEAQSQQQGQAGSEQVSGEPGAGLPAAGVPAGAGPITTGGPAATGETGLQEPRGDRPAEPIEEPAAEPVDEVTELEDLVAEEDAALEAELEQEGEAEAVEEVAEEAEPAIEEMSDEEIDALLAEEGEEEVAAEPEPAPAEDQELEEQLAEAEEAEPEPAPEPKAEKPEKTGPSTAKPAEEPTEELEEPPTVVEPEEEAAPEPERKYVAGEGLKGKTVTIEEVDEDGNTEVVVKPADEVVADIDNRLSALQAFKECMG